MIQAKSVMEKRKHHLHSSIRMKRNIRRSSSTSIIFGKQKHSNSTNFQTEYSEHKNPDWPPLTHHQKLDARSSNPHISSEDTCSIQCHSLTHRSLQTKDENKENSSESSNHLVCVAGEEGGSLSCFSDLGPVKEDEEIDPAIVRNMSANGGFLTADNSVDKYLENVFD